MPPMQTAFGQVAPSRVCGLSGAARRANVIARAENNKIQKVSEEGVDSFSRRLS